MGAPILVAGLVITLVGCSSLGDPIPSYAGRAQGSKEQDERACEHQVTGANVTERRLKYISCMIARGWRVYVPIRSTSVRGIANLTVERTGEQSADQVFDDLTSCAVQVDVVVGTPTIGAAGVGTSGIGMLAAGGAAAYAGRLIQPFAGCLTERGYKAVRWDGS